MMAILPKGIKRLAMLSSSLTFHFSEGLYFYRDVHLGWRIPFYLKASLTLCRENNQDRDLGDNSGRRFWKTLGSGFKSDRAREICSSFLLVYHGWKVRDSG